MYSSLTCKLVAIMSQGLAFILICYMLACDVNSEIDVMFRKEPVDNEVFEGMSVNLKCWQDSQEPISIIFSDRINIVGDSRLIANASKYSMTVGHEGSRYVYTLTIKGVGRDDEGTYFCTRGFTSVKQLFLIVYYRPNERVDCVASCDALTYFYDSEFLEYFQLNCSVKNGNPSIDLAFRINNTKDVTMIERYTKQNTGMTITFTSSLNSSYNNSHITCNAVQYVQPQFTHYSYNDTCTFKPIILLPHLDISITPSNVAFIDGINVTLTCVSHLCNPFVETTWVNISSALKYSIVENGYEKHLTVFEMDDVTDNSINIVCQVTLRNRTRSVEATIHKKQQDMVQQDSAKLPVVIRIIIIIIVVVLFVVGLLVGIMYFYRDRFSKICRNTEGRTRYIGMFIAGKRK